ncbi:hypothetical protein FRC00_003831 [Tulasnella sp. 408]|nr:hypothetical protein FRC00_003831 [Tulasnella sp. 408]
MVSKSSPPTSPILSSESSETPEEFYHRIATDNATRTTSLSSDYAWTHVTITNVAGNHDWVDDSRKRVADFIIFGEVLSPLYGTRISAKGNVYPPNKQLHSSDKIKWAFAIGLPSDATHAYNIVHDRQLSVIHREFDDSCTLYRQRAEEARNDPTSVEPGTEPEYKHFLRSSDMNGPLDTILLTTENIYTMSASSAKTLGPGAKSLPSRLRTQQSTGSSSNIAEASASVNLKTTYSPAEIFPDHTGEQFLHHQGCRVVQLDFRDIEGNLVPMGDVRRVFRPGTFIQSRVTLHAYDILDQRNPKDPRRTRSHLIRLRSAQVLRESDEEYEPIYLPPTVPNFSPIKRSNEDASPSKKRREPRSPTGKTSSAMSED